ncbi:MAG: Uncharacterized protein Greene041619_827 [Candidatus Peregrinibacteria bacterium Greene0416_19]|nr:MAG: Uncharacterized protein Greene041619_827 [Candidatus Peregrinibacteria bacterium Greene0416_19]
MNFIEMSHLAHAMEDVFEEVHTKKGSLSPSAIETLFAACDMLSLTVSSIKKGEDELSTLALRNKLERCRTKKNTEQEGVGGVALAQKPETIAPIEAIKVDVATLDKLMNLTEELLVERMKVSEIVRQAKEKPDEKLSLVAFESSSEALNRLIAELQLHVTQARMVPLGQISERFPRMIRDLAHEQGKDVEFLIEGQDIELDRTVIDRLGEPLIHLLRNAVDHGIEKKGTIRLTARRERDTVMIAVTNDGTPIDWQKVIETALSQRIIDRATRDRYSRDIGRGKQEIEDLLYRLSTNDKVTETSGRGVGLGIVKSVIESLGGRVTIESKEGDTSFILSLPLTLAIIPALLFRVHDRTFALPLSHIDRSVSVPTDNIKGAFGQEVAVVSNEDIPMVRLQTLFGMESKQVGIFLSDEQIAEGRHARKAELMIITKHERLPVVGLVVDELISKQDIVVKPLKGSLRHVKRFAGVTLLGDGRPALILDIATLV